MRADLYSLWIFILACSLYGTSGKVSPAFEHVGCSSIIKLTHNPTGFKLHSHSIAYGGGSQQQSVTAFPNGDDSNSLWQVQAPFKRTCVRGDVIPCGSMIRLFHLNTRKYLHSHLHRAPISSAQEVSAFEQKNNGDNWILNCKESSDQVWQRGKLVTLSHMETSKYLSSNSDFSFQGSVAGQLEVCADEQAQANSHWRAEEGMYFKIDKAAS